MGKGNANSDKSRLEVDLGLGHFIPSFIFQYPARLSPFSFATSNSKLSTRFINSRYPFPGLLCRRRLRFRFSDFEQIVRGAMQADIVFDEKSDELFAVH